MRLLSVLTAAIAVVALLAWQWPRLPGVPSLPSFAIPAFDFGTPARARADTAELRRRVDALVTEFPGKAAIVFTPLGHAWSWC